MSTGNNAGPSFQAEHWLSGLRDKSVGLTQQLSILHELRDAVDFMPPTDLVKLSGDLLPISIGILRDTKPEFSTDRPEQKLRNAVLDTVHKISANEGYRLHAVDLYTTMITVLRTDNDENAVLALKIIISIYKQFKSALGPKVQDFIKVVIEVYQNIPQVVAEQFDNIDAQSSKSKVSPSVTASPKAFSPSVSADGSNDIVKRTLSPGMKSFKVVTEFPIIVVLLFQSHRELASRCIYQFAPLVVQMLALDAKVQLAAHKRAQEEGRYQIGIVDALKGNSDYCDLLVAQVKTMSFLAYLLRGQSSVIRSLQADVPDSILRLLKNLPMEMSTARKELLVATRHILSTDYRNDFISKTDELLNERILVGEGVTAQETLKPLAYSMLADLLHHVRSELNETQIIKAIDKYCGNLQNSSMPTGIQTMSAKLVLNMIDRILKIPDQSQVRFLLVKILSNFIEKLRMLNHAMSISDLKIQADATEKKESEDSMDVDDIAKNETEVTTVDVDESVVLSLRPIKTPSGFIEGNQHKDNKFLFKTLIIGLKTILFGLKACNPSQPPTSPESGGRNWTDFVRGLTSEEVAMFRELLREGLQGFRIFRKSEERQEQSRNSTKSGLENITSTDISAASVGPTSREEKELLETFATVFIHLDPATFIEIWELDFPEVFEQILLTPSLIHIPQHLLANENTSASFEGISLRFAISKLDMLGNASIQHSAILLRLLRLCFMAVTMFPESNEPILQPYVSKIIIQCMQLSNNAPHSHNYFLLLKYLFRGVGGGRFDILYKEVMPLLQVLLECLNSLLLSARNQREKELYAELCLTVPVRLSVLLPYMSFLMKPLVVALQGSPDLVSQGLRTFELCLDNLTQEFLDPILSPVMHEIMSVLWSQLKPLPHNHQHSHNALKILGKLGGRNRKTLTGPENLSPIAKYMGPKVSFRFHGSINVTEFPIGENIDRLIIVLLSNRLDDSSRVDAFVYLDNCMRKYLEELRSHDMDIDQVRELSESVFANNFEMDLDSQVDKMEMPKLKFDVTSDNGGRTVMPKKRDAALESLFRAFFNVSDKPLVADNALHTLTMACRAILINDMASAASAANANERTDNTNEEDDKISPFRAALVTTIIEALSSTSSKVQDAAYLTIDRMLDFIGELGGDSSIAISRLKTLSWLNASLSHSCFQELWYLKAAGTHGIRHLMEKFKNSPEWLRQNQIEFIRALFYVMKDNSHDMPSGIRDIAAKTVKDLIAACKESYRAQKQQEKGVSCDVLLFLVLELASSNQYVRDVIQECLALFADIYECTLSELLEPYKDKILTPIFQKPLRALPFAMQTNHIDAVTYCLSLRPTFLEFSEELLRLLHEALALADAEDEALVTINRTSQYKSFSLLVKLRVVCIKLLSTALSTFDFTSPQQLQTRGKIIGVFFKSLYVKSPEIVDVANKGLRSVLSQNQKLPKELLQGGLRPILMNLSDHKRLTVTGLEGLARLLELLTNYFKVEIGRKLLDHLKAWAEPQSLAEQADRPLEDQPTIKIITAILNIFHLLPSQANMFLEELVRTVLETERGLKRTQNSPLRLPLIKYLNRYSQDSCSFFLKNAQNPYFSIFFGQILEHPEATDLRVCFLQKLGDDKALIQDALKNNDSVVISFLLRVIASLCNESMKSEDVCSCLDMLLPEILAFLKGREFVTFNVQPFWFTLEAERSIIKIISFYLEKAPKISIKLIFDFAVTMTNGLPRNYHLFGNLLRMVLFTRLSEDERREFVIECLSSFCDVDMTQHLKAHLLRLYVLPAFTIDKVKSGSLVRKDLIDQFQSLVWRPALSDYGHNRLCNTDQLRMELLQLSCFLTINYSNLINDYRKDIIKFSWNYIKLDDITTKHAAYVTIAYFIAAFDTPVKIVTQIYVALLRANQSESRVLVRQALGAIGPVLPKRIPLSSDSSTPAWAKWPRRVISEDSGNMSIVCNVCHFITTNSDTFRNYADILVPIMGASITKMAFQSNASSDARTVAVEVTELISSWDIRARQSESSTYVCPPSLRETVISFLIRFTCLSTELYSRNPLCKRVVDVLETLMKQPDWMNTDIKLSIFSKILSQMEIQEQNSHTVANALRTLAAVIEPKPADRIIEHLPELRQLIDRCLKHDSIMIQNAVQPVLSIILKAILSKRDDEGEIHDPLITDFMSDLSILCQELLQNASSSVAGIYNVSTIVAHDRTFTDSFLAALVKLFARLVKDHVTQPQQSQQSHAPTPVANSGTPDGATPVSSPGLSSDELCHLLNMCMSCLKERVVILGDQRRFFLGALIQLVERSSSLDICRSIIHIVREWVFSNKESFPTTKEKTLLLLKMTTFEYRSDQTLMNEFLDVIIEIYEDPAMASTELTVRLEQVFLIGTRSESIKVRNKFMSLFNQSMSRNVCTRLNYVIGVQNWELIGGNYWILQANQLLLGAFGSVSESAPSSLEDLLSSKDLNLVDQLKAYVSVDDAKLLSASLVALGRVQFFDHNIAHALWKTIFGLIWRVISPRDRQDVSKALINLLSKDYHIRQMEQRPNCIQTILESCSMLEPRIVIPPHLVKYCGTTYSAHYTAINLLEQAVENPLDDRESKNVRASTLDALVESYALLSEDDMFYGTWRRRSQYLETNAALSYEQHGLWDRAQSMYETAQVKARTGVLPFSESEYNLWEDHWILCTQKLQQWEILNDLAKHEGYTDLMLECAWRLSDWNADKGQLESWIKSLADSPSLRRYTFESFMALQKSQARVEPIQEFNRILDEGMQVALRKWHQLPSIVSQSHVPLLQNFQQFVELHEASSIYASLNATHAQNLHSRAMEIKNILQTWRDRLPNLWDDINVWSDLVAWRQLVFSAINRVYLPLAPQSGSNAANSNATSYLYRGYHETAWIINRFAHVARKHQLPEVCINQLTKIYTLPNIEIQEAFLKLREQAKCHYQNGNETQQGLEVISNTNLMYFGVQQKAEFFTLKGMFLAKLRHFDEANQAFATAVQIDLTLAKAWAEWGRHNDYLYKENTSDISAACNAVSCYLQAAGLYQNGKARKVLNRVLWLLSFDDSEGSVSKAFDSYRGEVPVWYWITFVPQLLTSLSHKEARHVRNVLARIAKTYPQALHFQLRTTRDDYTVIKRQALAAAQNAQRNEEQKTASAAKESDGGQNIKASTPVKQSVTGESGNGSQSNGSSEPSNASPANASDTANQTATRQPWEHVDDIMSFLKTAYPLLALTMETMVDQIQTRFKSPPDEDAYRLIVALLNDGVQYIGRIALVNDDTKLPPATQANISRFAESVLPKHIKSAFEDEFVHTKPNLQAYVEKLRRWRDRFEYLLDQRNPISFLEQVSPWLCDFQSTRFDDVEVPGQYLLHKDNNSDFVRISRFLPDLAVVRGQGICYRRMTMRGHDGSLHPFAVQYPAARHCRREERIMQLFRILDGVLTRKRESRRRGIRFDIPVAIPLAPHIRIVKDDPCYVSFQNIFEKYCKQVGMHKDEPLKAHAEKIKSMASNFAPPKDNNASKAANDARKMQQRKEMIALRTEILEYIRKCLVPDDIFTNYFQGLFQNFGEFWVFRKKFSLQYAALSFMTYIISINLRFPHKFLVSQRSGQVIGTELLPAMASNNPIFFNGEAVPFRFTPNVQHLIGPIGVEGVFSCALMAIARCLSEPEFDLDQHLGIFVRDELIWWFTQQHRPIGPETPLREKVNANVEQIVRRVSSLSQTAQGNLPANQTIIDLISQAVNPRYLAQMDQLWAAWI